MPALVGTMKLRVKVCCITDAEQAELAIRCGVSALGFVSAMPSGPGIIPEEHIAEIIARLPPGITSFLLTSAQDPERIIQQQQTCLPHVVQICDSFPPDQYRRLSEAMPGVRLVQVIHVTEPSALDEAVNASRYVDALLLDSGDPALPIKQLGGTGRTHDWAVSRAIRESVQVPVFLAGGLTPSNVGLAIRQVSPFGVDVCSGVRRDGRLDERLLREFIAEVDRDRERTSAAASLPLVRWM